jgi:hypothetical protein
MVKMKIQCYAPVAYPHVTRPPVYLYSAFILVFAPRVDDYHLSAVYVYHRSALAFIPDIAAISMLSSFRSTRVFSFHLPYSYILPTLTLHLYFGYPPVFLARVSHFCSYDSNLFCYLLSTILRTLQYITKPLTRLLSLLRSYFSDSV